MTDEEREFWKAAFLAALSTVIRMPWETNGKPDPLSAETFAIVAGRIADESLREWRGWAMLLTPPEDAESLRARLGMRDDGARRDPVARADALRRAQDDAIDAQICASLSRGAVCCAGDYF